EGLLGHTYNPGMHTSGELRAGFRAFFESKGHTFRPSASLIPRADDRSTLLTTAGMQPLMPYFLGREPPPAPLLTTVQKSFRTPDIDEVGLDGSHLTFFEMLGNFSFGQYFKEGAIELAWEFVFEHRSEEHTSELQSRGHLVCRLLLEKKKHNSELL